MQDKNTKTTSLGDIAAKLRNLGFTIEFAPAPVDFADWISSNRSDEEVEEFIARFESKSDDGSVNYQNNKTQIAKYRAGKLTKE